jgi:hypothetical protein
LDRPADSKPPARGGPSNALRRALGDHPVIAATMLACTLLGAAIGWQLLGDDWSLARRLVAGAIGGAGTGFLITATKML